MVKNGRPGLPRVAQVWFWDGVRAGLGTREARGGGRGGQERGGPWFARAGGVKGNGPGRVSGRYLSLAEREEIAVGWRRAVVSAGRGAAGTAGVDGEPGGAPERMRGVYRAVAAQAQAEFRAAWPKTAKLAGNLVLREQVQAWLGEVVAGADQRHAEA